MVRYLAAQWHDGRLVSTPILLSEPADEAHDALAHAEIEAVRQSDEVRYRPRAGWHS